MAKKSDKYITVHIVIEQYARENEIVWMEQVSAIFRKEEDAEHYIEYMQGSDEHDTSSFPKSRTDEGKRWEKGKLDYRIEAHTIS